MIGHDAIATVTQAEDAVERSIRHMKDRHAFGKALTEFQALRFKIADMARHAHAAKLMPYDAAARKDAGEGYDREASMGNLFATEKAMEAAHRAVQIHGGNGIMVEYPVSRAFGDANVREIVEGISEIQRMIIARAASVMAVGSPGTNRTTMPANIPFRATNSARPWLGNCVLTTRRLQ